MANAPCDVRAFLDPDATPEALKLAQAHVRSAGAAIAAGQIVVFATETSYGLAALPTDARAVAKLAVLKGRDKDKPIALIAENAAACAQVAMLPAALEPLAEAFWPGPLTLLLPVRGALVHPIAVPGPHGLRVGVRVSSHPVACALAQAAGGIITATSANLSGQPAASCLAALGERLRCGADILLDAGTLADSAPSSIVGYNPGAGALTWIRPGAIDQAAIEAVFAGAARG